ncbi:MAG: hypothetical protein Gyms2KO_34160 [Gymnodinialimonas sp.]
MGISLPKAQPMSVCGGSQGARTHAPDIILRDFAWVGLGVSHRFASQKFQLDKPIPPPLQRKPPMFFVYAALGAVVAVITLAIMRARKSDD